MERIIKTFCESQDDFNFFRLCMPTGTGKTHVVLDYMEDCLRNKADCKIVFTTTLKNNLPYDEFLARFKDDEKHLTNRIYFADSNREKVYKTYEKIVEYDPDVFERMKEIVGENTTKKFKSAMETYRLIRNNIDMMRERGEYVDIAYVNSQKDTEKTFDEAERNFRRQIHLHLNEVCNDNEEKMDRICNDVKYAWIGTLYPDVFIREKKIIFLSIDKFLMPFDTITDRPCRLYESDILDGATVFIDEFDAAKDTMLKNLIKNELRILPHVDLFERIKNGLEQMDNHRRIIYQPSYAWTKRYNAGKSRYANPGEYAKALSENCAEIERKFELQYAFKVEGSAQDCFMFRTFKNQNVGKAKDIHIKPDKEECTNVVTFDHKRDIERTNYNDQDEIFVEMMNGAIYTFIKRFEKYITQVAKNYLENMLVLHNKTLGFENSVKSMLGPYRLTPDMERFLISEIISISSRPKSHKEDKDDTSIYNRGFRFYNFVDAEDHDSESTFMMTALPNTPEKVLTTLMQRAKVIGISATGKMETVLGNFDTEYMKGVGACKEYELTKEQMRVLRNRFYNSIEGYVNKKVVPEVKILGDDYDEAHWAQLIDDPDTEDRILSRMPEKDKNNYLKNRYMKIAKVYRDFITNPKMRGFICFLNKHPVPLDKDLDSEVLKIIFKGIDRHNGIQHTADYYDTNIVIAKSEGFKHLKKKILERLKNGEKVFLITTYQTLGAGQNIQYPVTNPQDYIQTNENPISDDPRKDFDGIYLDTPTHVFPEPNANDIESLIKTVSYIEFLYAHREISPIDEKVLVNMAFDSFLGSKKYFKEKVGDLDSVKLILARQIIQAIGRVCRTNLKNPEVYIYADCKLSRYFDRPKEYYGELRNPEFDKLYDALGVTVSPVKNMETFGAEMQCSMAYSYIQSFLHNGWEKNRIDQWERLREFTMMYPTIVDGAVADPISELYYVSLPDARNTLNYSEENDYRHCKVSYEGGLDRYVSDDEARLKELLQIPGVSKFFEENKYATTFEKGKKIMSPVIFNNIYLGALGEKVGKYLVENLTGHTLDSLPATIYEKFDFILKDGVYVDFKHWKNSTASKNEDISKKIGAKLDEVGGKAVFIINILDEDGEHHPVTINKFEDRIIEIPFLYDSNTQKFNTEAIEKIHEAIGE